MSFLQVAHVKQVVSGAFNVTITELEGAQRARKVARPRQVAMYLSKRLTPRSLPEIGRAFGGRDHTTVMHAVRVIEALRGQDCELRALIDGLEDQLRALDVATLEKLTVETVIDDFLHKLRVALLGRANTGSAKLLEMIKESSTGPVSK